MLRRRYLETALAVPFLVGGAGCLGDENEQSDTELVGRGTLRIENRSGGPVRAEYGRLGPDETIEAATLSGVELGVDGDSFEVTYQEVTGGPYRFVVSVPELAGSPVDQPWDLAECQEYTVTARILPDSLNLSGTSCVRPP